METNIVIIIVCAVFVAIWLAVAALCIVFRKQRVRKQGEAIMRLKQNNISLENHARVICYAGVDLAEVDNEKPEDFTKKIDLFDGRRLNSKASDKSFYLFFLPPGRHRIMAVSTAYYDEKMVDGDLEVGKTYVIAASASTGIHFYETDEIFLIRGLDDKVTIAIEPATAAEGK